MRHYAALVLAILGWWQEAAAQYYNDVLVSDNGMPYYGLWGDYDPCPYDTSTGNQTYTYSLEFKYDDLDDLDFIGGDSVKLYCRNEDGAITGYISSLEGKNGEWQGIRSCPDNEYFTGFRLRVFPFQGTWGDDFAVDNIQLVCSDGTIVDGLDGVFPPDPAMEAQENEDDMDVVRTSVEMLGRRMEVVRHRVGARDARLQGVWGSWAYCSPGNYVMGIKTVVEEGHVGDDMGLCDVTLYCA